MSIAIENVAKNMGIIAAALIRRDGTLEDSYFLENIDKDTFSIMCATIQASTLKIYNEIFYKEPFRIVIYGKDANLLIFPYVSKDFWALLVPITMPPERTINDFLGKIKSIPLKETFIYA
jgi:predicted regulator of Ras-like GTPase activity (Roadblock/LC7/MglB family)